MIVPMKKVAIIVQQKDSASCVRALGSLGVFHVEHQKLPQGKDINIVQEELAMVGAALNILSEKALGNNNSALEDEKLTDWLACAKHIIDLRKRLEHLEHFSHTLLQMIAQWQRWGDFDPATMKALAKKHIHIRLYQIPLKALRLLPETVAVKEIFTASGIVHCAVISLGAVDIPFKETGLPEVGPGQLRARYSQDMRAMQSLRQELRSLRKYRKEFMAVKKSLASQLEFQQAIRGMGEAGALAYLTGYVPFDRAEPVLKAAQEQIWGLVITDPSAEDNVPTLIRNPRWLAIVSPIFKFLEILPGYRELDISLPFLIFFSIFFGILIGDAGYGLVYLLLTYLIQRKMKKEAKQVLPFFLFKLLSVCAIIWGLLTATFFGQEWLLKAGYKPLLPILADEKNLQRFCFFLGALHLSIAHCWRAIRKAPSLGTLGDVGWIGILWSAFFIARTLILGDALSSLCAPLFITGAVLIIIFTCPRKNILRSFEEWASWLITLPFSFIGNFADVVSYIRLFAVGMAGIAIADAFNAMAAMIGQGSMLMIALAAFVALIGNVLGIILGPVSVLVHGVRLNLLEFSGHIGLSWSGIPYKPLKT